MKISEYAEYNKPRERARKLGFSNLTDAELLSLILRTGTKSLSVVELATKLIKEVKSLSLFRSYTIDELVKVDGIGEAKATSLLAAIELATRINNSHALEKKYQFSSPNDIFIYLSNYSFNTTQEEFYIICLNVRKEVLSSKLLFVGTIETTVVHPRDIFKYALTCSASFVVFAHNHPSRNLLPSDDDLKVTRKLVECGNLLNIKVLDHIIFSDIDYFSFRESGQM